MASVDSERVRTYFMGLQDAITSALEAEDGGAAFEEDAWTRAEGGGGRSRVIRDGSVFEKGGINFSDVRGNRLPPSASAARPHLEGAAFRAMGISLVCHPFNPHVPATHMNLRFFLAQPGEGGDVWWFGGGFDLTPYYGNETDARHWHATARDACAPFGSDLYPRFKRACDEYFYLPHRGEARGIGGIFFDDFNERGFDHSFAFAKSVGDHFLPAYQPILTRRKDHPYDDAQREFQLHRRGRYAEFNLAYDRGTRFGLQSGGRTESILMSLPPLVRWDYNRTPPPGSTEALLHEKFLQPRDWLAGAP